MPHSMKLSRQEMRTEHVYEFRIALLRLRNIHEFLIAGQIFESSWGLKQRNMRKNETEPGSITC